jgi:hypothetical protein
MIITPIPIPAPIAISLWLFGAGLAGVWDGARVGLVVMRSVAVFGGSAEIDITRRDTWSSRDVVPVVEAENVLAAEETLGPVEDEDSDDEEAEVSACDAVPRDGMLVGVLIEVLIGVLIEVLIGVPIKVLTGVLVCDIAAEPELDTPS